MFPLLEKKYIMTVSLALEVLNTLYKKCIILPFFNYSEPILKIIINYNLRKNMKQLKHLLQLCLKGLWG